MNRLKLVASLIKEDSLIDIGTDHGYLVKELLTMKKINKAICCDINQEPLNNAKSNIKNDSVLFILSDGLLGIEPNIINQYSAISICGMGGNLISQIIDQSIENYNDKVLYLQPNNNEKMLREYLISNNFNIINNVLVEENNIIYEVFHVIKDEVVFNDKELYFGKHILFNKDTLFYKKYNQKVEYLESLLLNINKDNIRYKQIKEEIDFIKEEL
ncbi:MAG: tRNA (adenine(22)-N(1))-methyltransferase [Mycoplasmatales bacterium]